MDNLALALVFTFVLGCILGGILVWSLQRLVEWYKERRIKRMFKDYSNGLRRYMTLEGFTIFPDEKPPNT